MREDLRAFREQPFELLARLEAQIRAARIDLVVGTAENWTGLGFRLGAEWLLAPQDEVREVIPPPSLTRVPNARAWLLGIANVRGSLLTVVDLHQVLGQDPVPPQRAQRVLVLKSARLPIGFLVDEVSGYRPFQPEEQLRRARPEGDPLAGCELGAFHRDGRDWRAVSLYQLAASDGVRQAGW